LDVNEGREFMEKETITTRAMRATEEDLRLFKACFEDNDDAKDLNHLRWQYLENPAKQILVDFAVAGSASGPYLAGIYATFPSVFRIHGVERVGVQSLDTLIDKRHRGKGLFIDLASQVYRRGGGDRHAFVYGFPNKSSAPGFFRKLGWVSLDPVPFLIKPLRSRFLVERAPRFGSMLARLVPDVPLSVRGPRLPAHLRFSEITRFDQQTDDVWREFIGQVPVALERNHDYMNWRLRAKPNVFYEVTGCFQDAKLLGFVVHTVANKHGGRIAYVVELAYRPEAHAAAPPLLRHAIARAREDRCDAVLAWCFPHAPNYGVHKRAGFFALPERLGPIELHFGVLPFDEGLRATLVRRESWYISYCDSDTV
jgi:GNAT superfamily N-acetyltransferase